MVETLAADPIEKPYTYQLDVGDWSGDGHEVNEVFVFKSNITKDEIRSAYRSACERFDMALHGVDDDAAVGNSPVGHRICDAHNHGYDPEGVEYLQLTTGLSLEEYPTEENYRDLFLWMVHEVRPDFAWELVEPEIESINAIYGNNGVSQGGFSLGYEIEMARSGY